MSEQPVCVDDPFSSYPGVYYGQDFDFLPRYFSLYALIPSANPKLWLAIVIYLPLFITRDGVTRQK